MDPKYRRQHLERFCILVDATKALFARLLFFVHAIFAVWSATCSTNNESLWALLAVQGVFIAETVYALYKRKGQEPKWLSPCILLYLITVIPPVWLINLKLYDCMHLRLVYNGTCVGFMSDTYTCNFGNIISHFDRKSLVYTVEQSMLLLLIIGRWMLPKGSVSRDQLSSLLLVYFGMAFDIMELFLLFEEPAVVRVSGMQYIILALWTLSLLQYGFVLTSTKSRRPRLSLNPEGLKLQLVACCQSELWSMVLTVVLQDGPFLLLRLYCLIGLNIFSYNLLFYTCKNVLVILLQAYRLSVLTCHCQEEVDTHRANIAGSVASSTLDLRQKSTPVKVASREQLYVIDRYGKLALNPQLTRDISVTTVDSRDLNFVSTV